MRSGGEKDNSANAGGKKLEAQNRTVLQKVARGIMLMRGLQTDFSPECLSELARIKGPASIDGASHIRDLRGLLWASIDNDDSEDLDQLTVAEPLPEGKARIRVAVADVDSLVHKGSAIDRDAQANTTTVYTAAQIFPMLPLKLSTNLTSLNPGQDRLAVVVDMSIAPDGSLVDSDVYRAVVHNHAKLAYNSVAAWLEGSGPMPDAVGAVAGLAENLLLQDRVAQSMKSLRHEGGALSLETIEARPVFKGERICDLLVEETNRAKQIIEDFMIAANGVTVRYLTERDFPSIRRVVRVPKRWDRIVQIAAQNAFKLPPNPSSRKLEIFLNMMKKKDPLRFPDLSLAIIKLLGNGEYVAERPGEEPTGHFGLAVKDYAHSTAPNRRYPDLITQRLLKAAIERRPLPYKMDELERLADHCTRKEDTVVKVERQVSKSAAALLLEPRIGERFSAMVTGSAEKGTWVRLLEIPVEGMLKSGRKGIDVGDEITVELVSVDVSLGFIDFKRVDG
ncbi:RNB domain-containing ribonuclease [Methanothrix sp.]|uniref:RNB domain-containing ribonuclease n=1 Tax=Methanothrix sp. TaxID=90426 RepID=UPI0032AFE251